MRHSKHASAVLPSGWIAYLCMVLPNIRTAG